MFEFVRRGAEVAAHRATCRVEIRDRLIVLAAAVSEAAGHVEQRAVVGETQSAANRAEPVVAVVAAIHNREGKRCANGNRDRAIVAPIEVVEVGFKTPDHRAGLPIEPELATTREAGAVVTRDRTSVEGDGGAEPGGAHVAVTAIEGGTRVHADVEARPREDRRGINRCRGRAPVRGPEDRLRKRPTKAAREPPLMKEAESSFVLRH